MSEHLEIVLTRLRNLLARIRVQDPDFDDLCAQHADLTAKIRKLNPDVDPQDAQSQDQLRRRRADLEQEMFAIMQANSRI